VVIRIVQVGIQIIMDIRITQEMRIGATVIMERRMFPDMRHIKIRLKTWV